MAQGLGEVAARLAALGVDLLREEAEVVPSVEEAREMLVGLVQSAEVGQGFHEPEGADDERALAAGQAVGAEIAVDELVAGKSVTDRLDGRDDARVGRREEPTSGITRRAASSPCPGTRVKAPLP